MCGALFAFKGQRMARIILSPQEVDDLDSGAKDWIMRLWDTSEPAPRVGEMVELRGSYANEDWALDVVVTKIVNLGPTAYPDDGDLLKFSLGAILR
jgi:hypothetical protein